MAKVLHYGSTLRGTKEMINFDTVSKRSLYVPMESLKGLEDGGCVSYLDTIGGWIGINRIKSLQNRKCIPTVFLASLENSEEYNLL